MMLFVLLCFFLQVDVIKTDDRLRPQYHLMPIKNWLNDPNGPVFFNGYYHMFFQHNPNAPVWGDMHWGHCYSTDMVHWIHLPIALAPDQTYDQNGIFTGSITIVNGIPTIVYTGITNSNAQVQCLARPSNLSDPMLTNWTKLSQNPIIQLPNGRDPSTAFEDDSNNYYLIYGYGTPDFGGQGVLFTSKDFQNWTYLHPIHGNHFDSFWECPDIFKISNNFVLKASLLGRDFWTVGQIDWEQMRFFPSRYDVGQFIQLIDHGKFYASKSFFDPINQQQVIFGWISEDDNLGPQRGWQGFHSLPRSIFLSDDQLEVRTRPIDALQTLRIDKSYQEIQNVSLINTADFQLLPQLSGNQNQLTINWQFPVDQDLDFGLSVLSTLNGTIRTNVGVLSKANDTFMLGMDLPGWDYQSVENIKDSLACYEACEQDSNCQSWTFVSNRVVNDNCFLKSGVPYVTSNSVCTSGVKQRLASNKLVWIYVDRHLSQMNPDAAHDTVHAPLWLQAEFLATVELDIFIDHSVIEIFEKTEGRFALTARVYPEDEDAEHFAFYVKRPSTSDVPIQMNKLEFWSLSGIWSSK